MKYTDNVLKHPVFREFIEQINDLEKDRIYCRHKLEHSIDVARLAWIYYLEDKITEDSQKRVQLFPKASYGEWMDEKEEMKDLFYTCALLHDIGRAVQYKTGVHHSIAGLELAKSVLVDIQAPEDWMGQILDVVAEHSRGEFAKDDRSLEYYIMKADHDCRMCFACQAQESCKWTEEEKNHTISS